jgi:hypothetical protein
MNEHTPEELRNFERELVRSPELVERTLETLPPALAAPERVFIKADTASVDAAMARVLALAVAGVEARIELIKQ